MAEGKVKRGDTKARRWALMQRGGKKPVPLDQAAQVVAFLSPRAGGATLEVACAVEDAAKGIVSLQPTAQTFATAGWYDVEFQITYLDGSDETVPSDDYFALEVVADLG